MKEAIIIICVLIFALALSGCTSANSQTEIKTTYIAKPSYYPVASYVPTTEPAPSMQNFTGTGQHATEKFKLNTGLATFTFDYKGKGHFSITLLNDKGEWEELIANDSGNPFNGSKAVGIEKSGEYVLDIDADPGDSWSITVKQ